MRLSMWVFADWLEQYRPIPQIQDGKLDFDTIRLLTKNHIPEENALYVGRMNDFFSEGGEKVFCVHNNDLILLDTDDLEEVFNQVIRALEFYSKWTNDMLEKLSAGCMISDLVKLAEPVIPHPVFVIDRDQRVLAYSSQFKKGEINEIWDDFLEYGRAKQEFVDMINTRFPMRLAETGIYKMEYNSLPDGNYSYNCFLEGEWIGVTSVIDKGTITRGQLDLFELFCEYVNRWFQSHAQNRTTLFLDTLIHSILAGEDDKLDLLEEELYHRGWSRGTPKEVFVIRCVSEQYNINLSVCKNLNLAMRHIYAVAHNSEIVLLCDVGVQKHSLCVRKLAELLRASNYIACHGKEFTGIGSFFEQYHAVMAAMVFCEPKAGAVYDYRDYALPHYMTVLENNMADEFLHPAVLQLGAYDASHNTEFARTLHCYLSEERSPTRTAEALGIHRNSLNYRLHRIGELVDVDMDSYARRLHLMMSFELLRRKKENNENSN